MISTAHNISHISVADELKKAMKYLDGIQNDCSHTEIAVVEIGCEKCGGGLASQLQLAAMKWMRTFSVKNYQIPVIIRGNLKKYSNTTDCDHVANNRWTCYFQPTSICEDKWLTQATIVPPDMNILDNLVPPPFEHMGVPWWWGVVQHRLFRLQESVERTIHERTTRMNDGKGFPHNYPIIGLHVRHGDKSNDGWKLQSFEDEIKMARLSPDCHLLRSQNISHHQKSIHKGVCLSTENKSDINSNKSGDDDDYDQIYKINSPSSTPTMIAKSIDEQIFVYVASDDPNVLAVAGELGHLVDESGVSQQTGTEGMEKYLLDHEESRYNATIEIIQDIYLLSKCSTLVGMAASQIFRMSVGLSQASGILNYAIASDFSELSNIIRMSWWLRLIVPEPFHSPDGTEINKF